MSGVRAQRNQTLKKRYQMQGRGMYPLKITGSETISSDKTCLWGGGRSPMPFVKIKSKKCLVFEKKCNDCFHL